MWRGLIFRFCKYCFFLIFLNWQNMIRSGKGWASPQRAMKYFFLPSSLFFCPSVSLALIHTCTHTHARARILNGVGQGHWMYRISFLFRSHLCPCACTHTRVRVHTYMSTHEYHHRLNGIRQGHWTYRIYFPYDFMSSRKNQTLMPFSHHHPFIKC